MGYYIVPLSVHMASLSTIVSPHLETTVSRGILTASFVKAKNLNIIVSGVRFCSVIE